MTQQVPTETIKNKNGALPEDDFQEVVLDRPSFKPESFSQRQEGSDKEVYKGLPVQGWLIGHAEMGDIEDDEAEGGVRKAFAYMIKLTKPVKCKNRDGDVIDCKPGDEIYVWESAQIKQAIPATAANHPALCLHVRLTPKFRAPLKGQNRKMWNWEVKVSPNPKPRKEVGSGSSLIAQLLATAAPLGQLPAAGEPPF